MAQPVLEIKHVPTGLAVQIERYGFNEFTDTITTKYNSVNAYGRMDPIVNYQGSPRKITLGITIWSDTIDATTSVTAMGGKEVHLKISRLQKMQYPVYVKGSNALTIQRPPLVLVSLANLIRDGDGLPLLCAMNGFAFTPSVGFTPEDSPNVRWGEDDINTGAKGDTFSFQRYSLKFDFTVLHRRPPGFTSDEAFQSVADPDGYPLDPAQVFMGGFHFGPRHGYHQPGAQFAPTTGLLAEEEKVLWDIFGQPLSPGEDFEDLGLGGQSAAD